MYEGSFMPPEQAVERTATIAKHAAAIEGVPTRRGVRALTMIDGSATAGPSGLSPVVERPDAPFFRGFRNVRDLRDTHKTSTQFGMFAYIVLDGSQIRPGSKSLAYREDTGETGSLTPRDQAEAIFVAGARVSSAAAPSRQTNRT
jgi:hypothetical protein